MAASSSSSPFSWAVGPAMLRLMADLKAIKTEAPEGCFAGLLTEDNLFEWSATILGPYETPWEGGVFELRLKFPATYPQTPPGVRFISQVYHPNEAEARDSQEVCSALYVTIYVIWRTYFTPYFDPKNPYCVSYFAQQKEVSTRGEICADIFRNAWSPCNTVSSILASIQSLLNDPNPSHPKNPGAAQLYINDRREYNRRVRLCAEKTTELAGPSCTSQQ